MSLLYKPLDQVSRQDIQDFFEAARKGGSSEKPEGRDIDYKREMPNSDELLADVTSFANTVGGHLVVGFTDEDRDGLPDRIEPLPINPDVEKQRLENILRDSVKPRLMGVKIQPVQIEEDKYVIVIRIPRSFSAPHRAGEHGKFYARCSTGKYSLAVEELRHAFLETEGLHDRIRNWQLDRIVQIKAGETPAPTLSSPKIVLHMVPLSPLSESADFQPHKIGSVEEGRRLTGPIGTESSDYQCTDSYSDFDGYVYTLSNMSYLHAYRDGRIEAVESDLLSPKISEQLIYVNTLENYLIDAIHRYTHLYYALSIDPPIIVMVSIIGIEGYKIRFNTSQIFFSGNARSINKKDLLLPSSVLDRIPMDKVAVGKEMKPVFDRIWYACGVPTGSQNYVNGEWQSQQ